MFKAIDRYGQGQSLNIGGKDTHKTYIGATFTVVQVLFILIYGLPLINSWYTLQNNTTGVSTIFHKGTEVWNATDVYFDFGIALFDLDLTKFYDDSYFNVDYFVGDDLSPVPTVLCKNTGSGYQPFEGVHVYKFAEPFMKEAMCLEAS
jgi:hypothetical protein